MKKITPHLWFDKEAREAAEFYCSLFPNSKIKSIQTLHNTPSGDADIVSFELDGYPFMAISAGPLFKFNPSVSFTVALKTKGEVENLWNQLMPGGEVLMPLDAYPFSEKYGWLKDKYGLSWQIVPMALGKMMSEGTPEEIDRITQAFLKMKKFDLAELERARRGE